MDDISIKYNLLDHTAKKTIREFVDFLLARKQRSDKEQSLPSYRKKILNVSTWSTEELKDFEEQRKQMGQWQPETW